MKDQIENRNSRVDGRAEPCIYVKQVESRVDAEAEQGEGPAAACASSSATGENSTSTSAVSVAVSPYGAAAACNIGVVVAGPYGAAAASEVGVVSVGPKGAAATSNAANSSQITIDGSGQRAMDMIHKGMT